MEVYPSAVEFALKILYASVATVGVASNAAIISIFITERIRMNSFKILLLNLSIADAISAVSIWPFFLTDLKSLRGMENANFLCALTIGQIIYWFSAVSSIFCLCLMSVNRYLAIRKPQRADCYNKNIVSLLIVCMVWVTAVAISLPNLFSYRYSAERAICYREWPDGFHSVGFSIITSILGFLFPISVITYTFFATRKYFWSKRFGAVTRPTQSVKRNRKIAIFMGLLIVAFFICWSPFFVYWILSRAMPAFFPKGYKGEYARIKALRIVVFVSLCNTVTNPIIYGLRGDMVFRRAFKRLQQAFCCYNRIESEIAPRHSTTREATL